MTYEQTNDLFEAMNDLETYSKLWQYAAERSAPDLDAVERYNNLIKVARKKIFNAAVMSHA